MSAVLVPVTVDTLVVRPGDAAEPYADTRYAVPKLPPRVPGATRQPRVRQAILPSPFAERTQPRRQGVHLHWAQPDALTRLDAETGRLPALPSRWIVVRLGYRAAAGGGWARVATAWLQPNVHDPTTTWIRNGQTGQHSTGEGVPALTMRGRGTTRTFQGWAFYADNVDGRLAFTDRLDHAADAGLVGPLAYAVIGWYTHRMLDPLRSRTGQTVWEILDDLGWSVDRTRPIGPPDRTIVHGVAVGIAWPTAAAPPGLPAERDLRPVADTVGVAFGDTTTSATATIAFPTADGTMAALAEAALAGELSELDEPDGLARLDATRHQLRFRGQGTGRGDRDAIFQSESPPPTTPPVPPALALDPVAVRAPDARALPGTFAALRASFAPRAPLRGRAGDSSDGGETGTFVSVRHPTPRRWEVVDPVAAFSGLGWSVRHGQDGRFDSEYGMLICRRTGDTLLALHQPDQPTTWAGLTVLAAADPVPDGAWAVTVPDGGPRVAVSRRLPGAVDLPDEVEPLVHELATVDPAGVPGYGTLLDGGADAVAAAGVAARLDWWTLWADPVAWRTPPTGRFTLLGTVPCPLAVTRPSRAWVPMHVDWRLAWTVVPRGTSAFPLGEVDFEAPDPWPSGWPAVFTGRGILTDAPMRLLALAASGPPPVGLPPVPDLDVSGCSLDGFLDRVRQVPEGLWVSPDGVDDVPPADVLDAEEYTPEPIAAGTWDVRDLRVVDAFGRTLKLIDDGVPVATVTTAETIRSEGVSGAVQRPRFTAPVTVEARFLDPTGAVESPSNGSAAPRPVEITAGQNPIVGWFAPTPLDGSVELFDPDGQSLGRLAIDRRTRRTEWEDTPADAAATAGVVDPLDRIPNPVLARVARSLVEADRPRSPATRSESALGVLLRLVDMTLRFVDATGGLGTGHLGLLLGTPVAVVRVGVTVDVRDPQSTRWDMLTRQLVPVRIGSVTRLADGVVAFWAEDQPDRLYPVHQVLADEPTGLPGEDATPIVNPYLSREPVIWMRPGSMRNLTLLVAPGAQITATTGLAPRKALDLLPQWTDRTSARLIPTLAFDAVLRSVDTVTLPTADDVNGVWTWYSRPAGATAWRGAELPADPAAAVLGDQPSIVEDGFLRVRLLPPPDIKAVGFRVTCARRSSVNGPIYELGVVPAGSGPSGAARLPVDEAIRLIEVGRVRFFVGQGDSAVDVTVFTDPQGVKRLRAVPETGPPDRLLGVPECPSPVVVPNVVTLGVGDARTAITAAGLIVGDIRREFDAVPVGEVTGQQPRAGSEAETGQAVAMTVSDGPAVLVPDVVGDPVTVATTTLKLAGLTLGTVLRRFDSTVPLDRVVAQQPQAGAEVAQGGPVALTVSDGPAVAVPDVVGRPIGTAQNMITAVGLRVGIVQRRVDAAPEDIVVGQQPAVGTVVRPGTDVTLTVSAGQGVPVPNVAGLYVSAAVPIIVQAQLTVGFVQRRKSQTVPKDQVMSQAPVGGSRLPRGESVHLTVSDGPGIIIVPSPGG